MSVAILLVTHENIAQNMLEIAKTIINGPVDNIATLEVPMDAATEEMAALLEKTADSLSCDAGLLILTDIYGSTPGNIATTLLSKPDTKMISGVNLPMLIRAFNYRDLPFEQITDKTLNGGIKGIKLHTE